MNHKVTANLIAPKIPVSHLLGVDFFMDQNVRHNPVPRMRISENKECEMQYTHIEDIEIESPYYMSTVVCTDNETLIENLAEEKFDRVVNSISLLQNNFWGEYKIIKIDTFVRNEWKTVWSIFSKATRLSISHNPLRLESEELEKLNKILDINDKIYKKALYYLSEGEKRLNRDLVRGRDRIISGVFLNLFKPIELISNEICKKTDKNIPVKTIIRFAVNLFKFGKDKAVKELLRDYKAVKIQDMREKIKRTGEIFEMNETSVSKIIKYYQQRNEFDIAHARKSFISEMIDYAELSKFSRCFVQNYLSHKKLL